MEIVLPSAPDLSLKLSSSPPPATKDTQYLPDYVEQCSLYLHASFSKMVCSS